MCKKKAGLSPAFFLCARQGTVETVEEAMDTEEETNGGRTDGGTGGNGLTALSSSVRHALGYEMMIVLIYLALQLQFPLS